MMQTSDSAHIAISPVSLIVDNSPVHVHVVWLHRTGMALLKQEKDEEALADFTMAVDSEGGKTEGGWILNRGLCNARLGNWKDAIKDYTAAITLNPRNPTALTNRGIIYQRRKMWETAIEDFDKAAEAADGPAGKGDALTHKAFCLLRLGKKKKALKAIEAACHTHKTLYACDYDGEDEIEALDMNAAVGELPDEEEALEGTGDAEDETWIPFKYVLSLSLSLSLSPNCVLFLCPPFPRASPSPESLTERKAVSMYTVVV
jgi:tetratricopeptide (TPR) repeat protein